MIYYRKKLRGETGFTFDRLRFGFDQALG